MKNKLSIITLLALFIGIVFGLMFPTYTDSISIIGTYYITFLKYMIVPVVFSSISVSIYDSRSLSNNLVSKSILLFAIMFISTFLISSLIIYFINPGSDFIFQSVMWSGETTIIDIKDILLNIIPKDLNKFLTGSYLFFVIIVSFIVGYVCTLFKYGEVIINIIRKIKDFLFKVLEYFMYTTPIAVISLISNTVSKYGSVLLGVGLKYIMSAYICGIICLLVVMILPVSIICKISPIDYIKKANKVWLMTISTCSSSATLPVTIKTCKQEFNVSENICDVVVPLGCTIHMCGGAISFALLGIFCSKLFNIDITLQRYLLMLVSSVLINMSAPGIPNGGVVVGATYLQLLGIPLDFIGFYSGIYKILDMLYTTLNVTGDITASVLLDKHTK